MEYDFTIRFNEKTGKWRVKVPMVIGTHSDGSTKRDSFWLVDVMTGDVAEFDSKDQAFQALETHYFA